MKQAKRLRAEWVTPLRAPGFGHKTAFVLHRAELLKTVMRSAIDGTLTPETFAQLIRARRNTRIYCLEMVKHLLARGHDARADRFRWAFKRRRKRLKREKDDGTGET